MNTGTLRKIAQFRGLTQSDLAKAAQVSRQAVSQWFCHDDSFISVSSIHLRNLSKALGTSADVLLEDLADPDWWRRTTTNLLWDNLYEDLTGFLAACDRGEPRALSRLVEVYGLFASAKILDQRIWKLFPEYKRYLPPSRRSELEQLWTAQKNLQLI